MKKIFGQLIIVLFMTVSAGADPIVFSSRADFDAAFGTLSIENWDSFAAGTTFANGSTVNGITYNSSATMAVVQNTFFNTTPPHGLGRTPTDFFSPGDTMTSTFSPLIQAFGIDINTFADLNGAYSAVTNLGDVVNSFFDPFPGGSTGQFVGFSSGTGFTSVTIQDNTGSFSYTLDTMRFGSVTAVPEAPSLLLLISGLVGIGLIMRSKFLLQAN